MNEILGGIFLAKYIQFFFGSPLRIFLTVCGVTAACILSRPALEPEVLTAELEAMVKAEEALKACERAQAWKYWLSLGVVLPDCDEQRELVTYWSQQDAAKRPELYQPVLDEYGSDR